MENKLNNSTSNTLQGNDFYVSLAPHVKSKSSVQKIMLDVIIALAPAMIGSIYFFKTNALLIILTAIISCVATEYIFQKITKKPIQIKDLSAIVTGILLAFNMPATAPLWMVAFGGIFAILIVKEAFGGIGGNFMNPALAARVVLMASWPEKMSSYISPDGIAAATPLQMIKEGTTANLPSLQRMVTGDIAGVIGETSTILLVLGGIYLIVRGVIDWKTPIIYVLTTALCAFILKVPTDLIIYEILGGGLILGAFFMATDYSSTPINKKGKLIFAIGCGILTAIIRVKGSMPEGVSYSILLMNVATPLIDSLTRTQAYGEVRK